MNSTREKIEELAGALLDDALDVKKPMSTKEKVEIFKPVALWYLGTKKLKKGDPDEDESGPETFENLRDRVNGKGMTQ